jgi:methylenetetrahydrofolate reductase (NADPH)
METLKGLKKFPTSLVDLARIFANYCGARFPGEEPVKYLPWSDIPLSEETNKIEDVLVKINKRGFLTINSQPAVDGAKSSDPVHGWGPRGGYVYQKVGITVDIYVVTVLPSTNNGLVFPS